MDPRMIIKAIKIKMILNRLTRAKENGVRQHYGLPPLIPWYEECYINSMRMIREYMCQAFCPCCIYHGSRRRLHLPKCCGIYCHGGTYQNEVIKNIIGFLGGVVVSLLLYFIMGHQMLYDPLTSFVVCVTVGSIFTLGLAFSITFRCLFLIILPHLFASKGRSFLLIYAMILVMNHPMKNFNRNIIVMSESSTCGQQMAYNQTKELIDAALAPMAGIIESVREVMEGVKQFAQKLRHAFVALVKAIEEIAAAIGRVFSWLGSIVMQCNDSVGQPYRKCKKAFSDASSDCRDRLGWFLSWICWIVDGASVICNIARIGELLCLITDAIKSLIETEIGQRVSNAIYDVYVMFYFDIDVHYHYSLNVTQTKTYGQVKEDIIKDIKARLDKFVKAIEYVQDILFITVTFVVLKAVLYRHKYLTKDSFDNIYLTLLVMEIDGRRTNLGKESIFPLSSKEDKKYIETASTKMARAERKKLVKGCILLVVSGCHCCFYLMCDYGLYWLLNLVAKHFRVTTHVQEPPHLKLHVQGNGALSDMYRALIGMFDPLAEGNLQLDTTRCLPRPYIPNLAVYETIGYIFLTCFFLTLFESYGLRLRHVIAGCFYPRRERQRAVWLYNHIIKMRGSFLKVTRRQIRRNYLGSKEEKKVGIRSRLAAQYPIARSILKYFGYDRKSCLVCSQEGKTDDYTEFTHCSNHGCDAVYCIDCFVDINNLCTVCMNPVDYGDFSDFSEERDSSDEEENERKKIESIGRKKMIEEKQYKRRPSQQLLTLTNMFGVKVPSTTHAVEEETLLSRSSMGSDSTDSDSATSETDDVNDYGYQYREKSSISSDEDIGDVISPPDSNVDLVSGDIFDTSDSSFSEDNMSLYDRAPEEQEMDRIENNNGDIEAGLCRKLV